MNQIQQSAVDQITGRPEYDVTRAILAELVHQFPDMVIRVFDHGHKVDAAIRPGVQPFRIANSFGNPGTPVKFDIVKTAEHAMFMMKMAERFGHKH